MRGDVFLQRAHNVPSSVFMSQLWLFGHATSSVPPVLIGKWEKERKQNDINFYLYNRSLSSGLNLRLTLTFLLSISESPSLSKDVKIAYYGLSPPLTLICPIGLLYKNTVIFFILILEILS